LGIRQGIITGLAHRFCYLPHHAQQKPSGCADDRPGWLARWASRSKLAMCGGPWFGLRRPSRTSNSPGARGRPRPPIMTPSNLAFPWMGDGCSRSSTSLPPAAAGRWAGTSEAECPSCGSEARPRTRPSSSSLVREATTAALLRGHGVSLAWVLG